MNILNMFKRKELIKEPIKEPIYQSEVPFAIEEAQQSYRLMSYGYLYEAPKDSYLPLYKELYDNVPVLDGAITAYTDLTCAGWTIESDSPEEAELLTKELTNTNFDKTLKSLMDSYFIYGFYGAEIVPNADFKSLKKIQEIPSTQIRLKRDKYGDIVEFVQQAHPGTIIFDPAMVLYSANRESITEPYGRSMFKSLPWITKAMLEIQDSMTKIYRRYGSPRFHVKYNPLQQLDATTLKARLGVLKTKFKDIEIGQDFFTAGDVEIGVIGGGKEQFNITIEMEEVMQSVFSGLKLPAGVLGYNYGSTETHLNKQIEILLGRILSYQGEQEHVINLKLMPILATIYGFKDIPKIKFNKPIIVDEAAEFALESAKINATKALLDMGLIDVTDAQMRLDLPIKTIAKPVIDEENPKNKGGTNDVNK